MTWRLSRTLARRVEVRPIENEDIRYAWAAYKKGSLGGMGAPFDEEGLDAKIFKDAFELYVLTQAHAAWTVSAQTKLGFMPVGLILGEWGPKQLYMTILGIVWFVFFRT